MNLLCPNCQKMLTVPEEFAGQLMKCPLCTGTFTVPGLPSSVEAPTLPPEPETYSLRNDSPPTSHAPSFGTPFPAEKDSPASPSVPPSPPPSPGEYTRTLSLGVNPNVLPWIAPVCLMLIFFLQFPSWGGVYPGGVPAAWQNAWQVAFGIYSFDPDLKDDYLRFLDDAKYKPNASALAIFYLLLFFPALLVTVASVGLRFIPIKLPPAVDKYLPWRWGIVAAANTVLFLFLILQILVGFSMDSQFAEWTEKQFESKEPKKTDEQKKEAAERGKYATYSTRTVWFKSVVGLHTIAVVAAVLNFWLDRRGPQRPLPKFELNW
jgi:cytochrome b561